ncbi:MAG TPA: 2-oxo acid dehydrogenase subunit E2 [Anaerohalosphaeraceae bacterium]|nr:2-oxo acid dehydrogenase subunit E2 [Anaerohalosphaeraceae bacterium]HRT50683.1 2-oxo acid dehydrogenase subunit E2 [Anaerohalosphaeraceae bacterium]HRT86665.1 2-oxo acid dehydrogenase subunit E2 [Anaerohalosphaeraceae bacterium]
MAREVKLPKLGQTMEEGTIVTSLVKVGDKVKKGDVIFEIETDKATLEMESPADGFVKKLLVEVGDTVPVNTPILILGEADEVIADVESPTVSAAAPAVETPRSPEAAPVDESSKPAGDALAVPPGVKVVRLPQLGQTMEEGTIVTSLIKVGDNVGKGQVIFEIETDKATLEMESPAAGVVKAILVDTGETVPVNTPIAVFAEEGVDVPQDFIDALRVGGAPVVAAPAAEAAVETGTAETAAPAAASDGRIFASPRARTIAAESGIDLRLVQPAPGAVRITAADVHRALQSGAAREPGGPAPRYNLGDIVPVNRLQKIVAERMLKSKQEIPCFYLNVRVDMTEVFKLRARLNKNGNIKLSFNDFIIRAVAIGLKHYPIMTGQLAGNVIQLADRIDIGLAISTDEGLVAPLVRDCGGKTVRQIAEYSTGLIERARTNRLTLEDLEGGCITVSNLGGLGVDSFIPIVVPGQCSILGVGRIADTCMPIDGNIMVRKMMNLNLSVDHKVANGADAAQFLDYIRKLLENPATFDE